jgi:hypothetical protein
MTSDFFRRRRAPLLLLRALFIGAHGCCTVDAWIRLDGIFTSNMVLQTPHAGLPPARIFGLAYTSEQVIVELPAGMPGPFTITPVKTGSNHWARPLDAPYGNWSVDLHLSAVAAATHYTNNQPFSITIRSKQNHSDATILTNVVRPPHSRQSRPPVPCGLVLFM